MNGAIGVARSPGVYQRCGSIALQFKLDKVASQALGKGEGVVEGFAQIADGEQAEATV